MPTYAEELRARYWEYQQKYLAGRDDWFEPRYLHAASPPVFRVGEAWRNVLVDPEAAPEQRELLLALVRTGERHKWFRSMNSSQALAQSLLGSLAVFDCLHVLTELRDDLGESLFGPAKVLQTNFSMEHKIHHLAEPHSTSLDCFISGDYQVAVECKFTESAFGACSRPNLRPLATNYAADNCNGSYAKQVGRVERCALTSGGVKYWSYVPQLFHWRSDVDHSVCPLHRTYQLVRNVLAVCVREDDSVLPEYGHVIVLYDARNPAFQANGQALAVFDETRNALKRPALLRKCSWQCIVSHLRDRGLLPWLTKHLGLKYGL